MFLVLTKYTGYKNSDINLQNWLIIFQEQSSIMNSFETPKL